MSGLFGQAAGLIFQGVAAATDYARGWGNNIKWHGLKEGRELAKELGKPAMIVIHTTSCRASKQLKPRFANSTAIQQLSQNFVMINVQDREDPATSELRPDGGYIPRILFTDARGNILKEVQSNNSQYHYFYGDVESITDSMKKVTKQLGISTSEGKSRGSRQGRKF